MKEILGNYGLEEVYSPLGDQSKFVSPDFEVEFLYPEKGKGKNTGKVIDELKIIATPLRYLNFIQSNAVLIRYDGLSVRVPQPVVFVLMKYLLVKKRKKDQALKIAKDIKTAKEFEVFLLDSNCQEKFISYFKAMPGKWQKDILQVLEDNGSDLLPVLKRN